MRLPYAPSDPPKDDPPTAEIYAAIAARRKPRPLIPLDLTLLHSPPVASGWSSFIGALRTQTALSRSRPDLVELAISRIAVLNRAVHEWNVHALLAVKAGVSEEGLETVRTQTDTITGVAEDGEGGLSGEQWAVLAYTDAMTRNVKVEDRVFEGVRSALGGEERAVVELTATVAGYNAVSRFLVALDVGELNGGEIRSVRDLRKEGAH